METALELIRQSGIANLSIGNVAMFIIAGVLIYLAIAKNYEPLLLIPIGFGAILANLPMANLGSYGDGIIALIYDAGIRTELLPPLIFLGVGALTDFRPLLGRPLTFLLGAAAQVGIVVAALGAGYLLDFNAQEAASIGIIGGADGPTSIFLASQLAPHLLGPIAVAAYSYMSLVPIIQPPIMRLLTTKKERAIDMPQAIPVSQKAVILFPIVTGLVASLAIPSSAPLIGMLMLGNLLRESGVTDRLRKTAGGALIDIVTLFLAVSVGATMDAEHFLTYSTMMILVLGAVAFSFSTAGGILFAKTLNLFLRNKINPCIGAAGVSAVPMSARVVQQFVSDQTDGRVNPLMPAMGPNVAGVIGSAVAAGVFLTLLLTMWSMTLHVPNSALQGPTSHYVFTGHRASIPDC
jgi:oxaloacetate decarboxylase beta subunit